MCVGIPYASSVSVVLLVIHSFAVVYLGVVGFSRWKLRNSLARSANSGALDMALLIGTALALSHIYFTFGVVSPAKCVMRIVVLSIAADLVFGSLLLRVLHFLKTLTASRGTFVTHMELRHTKRYLVKVAIVIAVIDVGVLIPWIVVVPHSATTTLKLKHNATATQQGLHTLRVPIEVCSYDSGGGGGGATGAAAVDLNWVFILGQFVFKGVLLFMGCMYGFILTCVGVV